jgi:hypothetical protein
MGKFRKRHYLLLTQLLCYEVGPVVASTPSSIRSSIKYLYLDNGYDTWRPRKLDDLRQGISQLGALRELLVGDFWTEYDDG